MYGEQIRLNRLRDDQTHANNRFLQNGVSGVVGSEASPKRQRFRMSAILLSRL